MLGNTTSIKKGTIGIKVSFKNQRFTEVLQNLKSSFSQKFYLSVFAYQLMKNKLKRQPFESKSIQLSSCLQKFIKFTVN